jgi:hypothetical protein
MDDVGRLARRIRRVLEARHAVHIQELRMLLGDPEDLVRAELSAMMMRGDIERLRPIAYSGEDRDFFRMSRPAARAVKPDEGWRRLAGLTMACLTD